MEGYLFCQDENILTNRARELTPRATFVAADAKEKFSIATIILKVTGRFRKAVRRERWIQDLPSLQDYVYPEGEEEQPAGMRLT